MYIKNYWKIERMQCFTIAKSRKEFYGQRMDFYINEIVVDFSGFFLRKSKKAPNSANLAIIPSLC